MNCPNCGQHTGAPYWLAKTHILWRNQWGQSVRIFCNVCGAWHDITQLNSRPDTVRVVRPPKDARVDAQG